MVSSDKEVVNYQLTLLSIVHVTMAPEIPRKYPLQWEQRLRKNEIIQNDALGFQ